jgi:hypothetical protein
MNMARWEAQMATLECDYMGLSIKCAESDAALHMEYDYGVVVASRSGC